MDHPIDGQQYTLIGDGSTPSIARGDSWEASKVTEAPKDDDTLLRETFLKVTRQASQLSPLAIEGIEPSPIRVYCWPSIG